MNRTIRWVGVALLFSLDLGVAGAQAQQPVGAEPPAPVGSMQQSAREVVPPLPVPRLVKLAGALKDEQGKARTGVVGVTFAVYKEQEGGAALWLETQNVELDEQGRYTVLLGSTKSEGLPLELFTSGEPRWLGVQVNLPKEMEQPRVLLVSVPYALKAVDAETLGGKPLSSFVLASPPSERGVGVATILNPATGAAGTAAIGGGGTQNFVAKFDATGANVINSGISDNGTRINAGEGIDFSSDFSFVGNAEPTATGRVQMFDRAFVGFVIRGLNVLFETLQGNPAVPVEAMRVTQSGNVGIGTSAPGQRLEVAGNLKLSGNGNAIIFPNGTVMSTATAGVGGGTITGVTAGTGLTGGGTTGGVNLAINPAVVPQLGATSNTFTGSITASSFNGSGAGLTNVNAAMLNGLTSSGFAQLSASNSFTGNQSVTGNLSLTGLLSLPATANASTGVITFGGTPFAHNFGTSNTFFGAGAGNFTTTGNANTASGANALTNNTTGSSNTANGLDALQNNTTGTSNSAGGVTALQNNTTGFNNTANGAAALQSNITGHDNTANGVDALFSNTIGIVNTASGVLALSSNTTGSDNTAVGYEAGVTAAIGNANTSGSNDTFIGFRAGPGTPTQLANATAIGANALVNCSNCLVLGDSTVPMSVGIRTNSPGQALSVAGTVQSITGGFMFPDSTVQTTASLGGSVTSVGSGLGLTGGPITGSGTLAINPTVVPQLTASSNTFTGSISASSFSGSGSGLTNVNPAAGSSNYIQNGTTVQAAANFNISGNGSVGGNLALPNTTSASVGVLTLGGTPFLHNFGSNNTFIGASAGNMTMTGSFNTVMGNSALGADTTGGDNSAFGTFALFHNTGGNSNSAFGFSALLANTTGSQNAAFGLTALRANITGFSNAAFGDSALFSNTSGSSNAAFGTNALFDNTTADGNSAFGTGALFADTTGSQNVAFGNAALSADTTGGSNSAFGYSALSGLQSGNANIAIGQGAGSNLNGAESNNIDIGNAGVAGESQTIRIGTGQTAAFVAGINGATSSSGVAVFVNAAGQLGTVTSSRRFKNDIADMGAESDLLMKLRPVAFYYKPDLDEAQTRQYGLVAEEVAQVAPQLVVFDKDGAPQTVRYHFVNAMLLNEVQKQRQLVEEQKKTITLQQAEIQDLAARLAKLETFLAAKP